MIRFQADDFVFLAREIGRLATVLNRLEPAAVRSANARKNDVTVLGKYRTHCSQLGLVMTARQLERIIDRCGDNEKLTQKQMSEMVAELGNRMMDECEHMHFLCLTENEKQWFEPDEPHFGKEVEAKLQSISEDIAEGAKCLALGRSTACVFHLMRVMETATQKLGDTLGVTFVTEKNWQNILDETNKAIRALDHKDTRTKALAEVSSHLYGVKVAWRNEVMHPKQTYTAEEATAIFTNVRTFIRELVSVI